VSAAQPRCGAGRRARRARARCPRCRRSSRWPAGGRRATLSAGGAARVSAPQLTWRNVACALSAARCSARVSAPGYGADGAVVQLLQRRHARPAGPHAAVGAARAVAAAVRARPQPHGAVAAAAGQRGAAGRPGDAPHAVLRAARRNAARQRRSHRVGGSGAGARRAAGPHKPHCAAPGAPRASAARAGLPASRAQRRSLRVLRSGGSRLRRNGVRWHGCFFASHARRVFVRVAAARVRLSRPSRLHLAVSLLPRLQPAFHRMVRAASSGSSQLSHSSR
jgi:hypothetical protein